MTEAPTFAAIRALFQDEGLRNRMEHAHSENEALGMLVTAGAKDDVDFSADAIDRLVKVLSSHERHPSDGDFPNPSMMSDTHAHRSCCTDCPTTNGLCK